MSTPVNVKFAEAYVGCNTLANIMGLHEETVRKRAARGQIPGRLVNRKWVFQHSELAARGIQPFASASVQTPGLCGTPAPTLAPVPPIARINRTDVVFVLDRSGSMLPLIGQARRNLQQQVDALRAAAGPSDEYRVTIVCFDTRVTRSLVAQDVLGLGSVEHLYLVPSGMTAMNDAIMEATSNHASLETDRAVLVSIVTDGGENASTTSARDVYRRIADLTATGRYTFAYAGPRGSESYAASIGVPAGNVTTWEQTLEGIQTLGATSRGSVATFTATRSIGVMSTNSYYAQPVVSNPQDFAGRLGSQLNKLDPKDFRVERVMDTDPLVIQRFAEAKLGGFRKGKVYYQLTESEKVQDYKGIVIQDTATGAFYAGRDAAAKLLGIPNFSGTVRIRPGDLGEFKVFVQSTSVNRRLVPGTAVVCLP